MAHASGAVILTSISLIVMLFGLGTGLAGAQAPGAALPPDPVLGTWKLNLAKSKYAIPAPKSTTVTITPAGRGYTFTIDAVGADGQPQKWSYTSAFDGAESPVTGNPNIDAVIASSQGSGTIVRYKKAGNVITTTTSEVSDDGRTLVVTIKVPDGKGNEISSTAVYERQ